MSGFALFFTVACAPPEQPIAWIPLAPEAQANRLSMALRSGRPSLADLDLVSEDPSQIPILVDAWLDSENFGLVVKDLHNEQLLVRNELEPVLETVGPLAVSTTEDLLRATGEEALELVRHIVTNDLPYSQIATADYMVSNDVLSLIYGLDVKKGEKGWIESQWADGRPQAGVLTSSELWRRHLSNGSNFNRGRANFVSTFFLCEDIGGRDVVVDGGVDLADEFAVADAVQADAGCEACHSSLEPIAAHFWGFKIQLTGAVVKEAINAGCHWPYSTPDQAIGTSLPEDFCIPLRMYDDAITEDWAIYGLPAPGFFGTPSDGLVDLGRLISTDPRFPRCAARRAIGFFHQVPWRDVPDELVEAKAQVLLDSGWSYKALVRSIVLDPHFLALDASAPGLVPLGPLSVRPEQWARTVELLTGFQWTADPTDEPCQTDCWDQTPMLASDRFGFRALAGGIDSGRVLVPTFAPTPTRILVNDQFTDEAAGYAVTTDFALNRGARKLFSDVELNTTDNESVRAQIVTLHKIVLAEVLEPNDAPVSATYGLWLDVLTMTGTPELAWEAVVAAMLRDPRGIFY